MEQSTKPRMRSEIPVEDTWALEDLFVNDETWEQMLATVAQDKDELATYDGHLCDAQSLYEYLWKMEQLNIKADRLANYCMRKADEDTREAAYQAMSGKFVSQMVALGASVSFESPQIMQISDEMMDDFYKINPKLERYRRYLTDLRRHKEHVLSPEEERILAAAGEMSQTPDTVYGMLTDADLTFADAIDSQGNRHALNQGTFIMYQESADRALRKSAYENLYRGFTAFKNTSAALLDAQNKKLKFFAHVRKYSSPIEAALAGTNVPVSVYENLIQSVHNNLDKLHRYVRLRKKILGVDKLHFYDIYTPLVADVDRNIPFAEAKQTVYDSLAPLGDEYRIILKEGFDNRWIDVYRNEGKRSGAYSAGAMVHPYVLLNYTGTLDSEFTLAHEMGHALHSYLSNKHQNPVDSDYVIFVAEVASTCNEALLMQHLLKKTDDKKTRAYLINHFLDQFKGTLYRQTMFAEFELAIGQMVSTGQTLTAQSLSDKYRELCQMYYGADIVVDDEISMEWARIPHFYYNYYVYQYATGYSAAIALSQRILSEGEPAVRDYLKFLSGGCSKSPTDLLKGAGVDMTSAKPVEDALQMFGQLLDEMEKLMEE